MSASEPSSRISGSSVIPEIEEVVVVDFGGRETKALDRDAEGSVLTRTDCFLGGAVEIDEVVDAGGAFLSLPAIGRGLMGARSLLVVDFGAIRGRKGGIRERKQT